MRQEPYLIQHLFHRETPSDKRGIDAHFGMGYMGSSEFEWGALPASLKRMRQLPVELVRLTSEGRSWWFVGARDKADAAQRLLADQLGPCKWHMKELTRLKDTFALLERDVTPPHHHRALVAGWWAIEDGFDFVIFHSKEHAETWLSCLVGAPAKEI